MMRREGDVAGHWVMPVMRVCAAILIGTLAASAFGGFAFWKKKKEEEPKLVVPACPSAKDQYAYALMYQRTQVLSMETAKRRLQLQKIMQVYGAVVENFPGDTTHVPLARLEIADCHVAMGDTRRGIDLYREIAARYPADEYVTARALYSTAKTYDMMKQYEKGKKVYKEIMEKHRGSSLAAVVDIAQKSEAEYYKVRDLNEGRKKAGTPRPSKR